MILILLAILEKVSICTFLELTKLIKEGTGMTINLNFHSPSLELKKSTEDDMNDSKIKSSGLFTKRRF